MSDPSKAKINRRQVLYGTVGGAALTALNATATPGAENKRKGQIKQSLVNWCFTAAGDKWTTEKVCQVAKELGCASVELVSPSAFSTIKSHGLACAIASNGVSGAPFKTGLNNPRYSKEVVAKTKEVIEKCSTAGCPAVIAFNGYKWRDAEDPSSGEISREEGAANCVAALKELAVLAEKKGVNVCLEHLNTRDDSHPMKGHPGYQGDDLDYVAAIIREVDSPRIRLLFDIYHVQVMHGDVIRRIDQNKDIIGHVHTAGCPGRGELDENQEILYPAVMRKLIDVGYTGYVGQEFIPTRDAYSGLKQAVQWCDV